MTAKDEATEDPVLDGEVAPAGGSTDAPTREPPGEVPPVAADHPFAVELDAEQTGWYALTRVVRSLALEERLVPGYYRDPDWAVRELVWHIGTWLAEAETQIERQAGGTYEGHDIDIDALNTTFMQALGSQPWEVAWTQVHAARTRMILAFTALETRNDETAWWIRKSGADHYAEHFDRLLVWADELRARRDSSPPSE
jgi:hypothetical protein